MSTKYHGNKEKRKRNSEASPADNKWYKKVKLWLYLFLALVIVRILMFIFSEGKVQTDDILLRLALVSLGTVLAWWYVSGKAKKK